MLPITKTYLKNVTDHKNILEKCYRSQKHIRKMLPITEHIKKCYRSQKHIKKCYRSQKHIRKMLPITKTY